ncbi:MAG: SRPBCC family protein [Candidatus Velthaea sp.]
MTLDDSFDVAAPIERVWPVLCDVPKVAGCMPNATITEVVDDRTYRATVAVKVGPVSVSYRATLVIESLDETTHTATLRVSGDESRGRGGVRATIISKATAIDGATHIEVHTDAEISGIIATLGGRLIEGVAKRTTAEFAANLTNLL